MLDLTDRIIQTPTTLTAPNGNLKWHPWRRVLQLLCGALLVALPLTNGLRLDVRRDEFYFAWHKMAAHDLLLLFWVAMLGVWSLVAVSFLYGRLWCGWVCPQTLASDFADSLKRRLDKAFRVRPLSPSRRGEGGRATRPGRVSGAFLASRSLWTLAMLAISMGTGMTLACYWLAPSAVLRGTIRPPADLPAALTVYGIAAVLAADMLWIRRRFCSDVCPYGMLMGLLADENTLAVRYLDEREDDCIKCGKCVVDCPMGIDIKQGVGQMACIGCGECVDSCNDVLGKRGKPGLIEFRYGLEPERLTRHLPPRQRWGLWDSKRYGVLAAWLLCLGIVLWYIYGRMPLTASVIANGAITRDARSIRNTYSLTLDNGTPDAQTCSLTVSGLPGSVEPGSIAVGPRAQRSLAVTVVGPATLPARTRVSIRLQVRAKRDQAVLRTIFYAPEENETYGPHMEQRQKNQ